MSLRTKLELHLADKHVTWSGDGVARWQEDGHPSLLSLAAPLTAASIVDAIVLAIDENARATVAFEGAPSVVAQRTAARLGVTLLDASALPEPPAATSARPEPTAAPAARSVPIDVPAQIGAEILAVALPAHEPELLLEAHVEAPLVCEPPLPWSGPAPEPAVADLHVSPLELLALPWHAELGDPHEIEVTERRPSGAMRPTQVPDWGLPWPRPIAPADGLAIADPKLWGSQDRIRAMRDDLAAKGGASFGQIVPQGSPWLKRLQNGP